MLVLGARGHASEILDILEKKGVTDVCFFQDNFSDEKPFNFNNYRLIDNVEDARIYLSTNPAYCIGVGNPGVRTKFYNKFMGIGSLTSIISSSAQISNYARIEEGVNIMHMTFISNNTSIEKGALINSGTLVHHDVTVGEFSEIGPGVKLLGNSKIGKYTFVGSGTIVLPDISIGDNAIVGAGSVVTKNIPSGEKWYGVPAKFVDK